MGITHFVRNAKPGTRFTVKGRVSEEPLAYEVAERPNCSPNLIVVPCFLLKSGQYAGRRDVTLRFGRDQVDVYGW